MFEKIMGNVRKSAPIVHNITNYVTVNDCANILLAVGASPIMADDINEVCDIVSISSALVINMGTLNQNTIPAMLKAGKSANEIGVPVIFDPVGAGASALRNNTLSDLLNYADFAVIRGNISEIKAVARGSSSTKGVDADISDKVTEENLSETVQFAKELSKKTGAVIAISGAIDIVANDNKAYIIRNGHPMMAKITGSGCMSTALIGAFVGANRGDIFDAAACAVVIMGLSGELAYKKTIENSAGIASFRNYLIDAVSTMDENTLNRGMQLEIR